MRKHAFLVALIVMASFAVFTSASGYEEELVEPTCFMFGDADCDEVPDGTDNCKVTPNLDQLDFDGDFAGDACDPGSGDVDCDDVVHGTDALNILRHAVGLNRNYGEEPCLGIGMPLLTGVLHGDINCDGKVNSVDSIFILRYTVRLSVVVPAGCPVVGPL